MKVARNPIKLYASAKAVVTQFLHLSGNDRVRNIVDRVNKLDDNQANDLLEKTKKNFGDRHRNLEEAFLNHFARINNQYDVNNLHFSHQKKSLLGAFFTKEYSIQAAALFNPSIVAHPDQKNLEANSLRFVMSLRATGEGHISSIVFQTGVVDDNAKITLDHPSGYFTGLTRNEDALYNKPFIERRVGEIQGSKSALLSLLPETFTAAEAIHILNEAALTSAESEVRFVARVKEILDTNYELKDSSHMHVNEKVISPNAKAESMGMEDVRLVQFKEGGDVRYFGTYTAYNGREIRTHMIETADFNIFTIRTLYGNAVSDKGMALFPEKINGQYVMISRQGGEKINIMFSDDLYTWDDYQVLMEPQYPWELAQLGNCGSPVKTRYGWLLLTHGVGVMRTYVISAILLDLNDPAKITGRLVQPLIEADEAEREGYVPNVVYTCGLLRHKNLLVIPYAVSDSATGFVTIQLDELISEMKKPS